MTACAPLLVELLTEELPPCALRRLADAFAHGIVERLNARALIDVDHAPPVFERHATPRRLAVVIHAVRAHAPLQRIRLKVLPVSVALDADGNPTPLLAQKLAALGITEWQLTDLERATDGKNETLFIHRSQVGVSLTEALQTALIETLKALPIPKMMRYPNASFPDRVATRSRHEDSIGIDAGGAGSVARSAMDVTPQRAPSPIPVVVLRSTLARNRAAIDAGGAGSVARSAMDVTPQRAPSPIPVVVLHSTLARNRAAIDAGGAGLHRAAMEATPQRDQTASGERHRGSVIGPGSDVKSVQFVRPAHRLIALHGDAIVPVTALGLAAGRTTLGHRFLSNGDIHIPHANAYVETLRDAGHVQVDPDARRALIRTQLLEQAGDAHVLMPDALLDEVTALVEWPAVYAGHFDAAFLSVPPECLILTMQAHQKYFALQGTNGALQARFLLVSNLDTPTPEHIIAGNERVVRARLADAKFFFEQDRRQSLAERAPQLDTVVYHRQLGSQWQRVQRIEAIASAIASQIGASTARTARAARLVKADLLTQMVGEFPELQGVMGQYYAQLDGEPEDIARACAEHYQPRFSGDTLPSTPISIAIALADKLETLVGLFGIGKRPTGDKDPFALRRHALGVLRILLEKALPLDLTALLQLSFAQFDAYPSVTDPTGSLLEFFYDRLRVLLRDRGDRNDAIDAVLSTKPSRLDDLSLRLDAVRAFSASSDATALAAAHKRIANILKKSAEAVNDAVQPALFQERAEQMLFACLTKLTPMLHAHCAARDYLAALTLLATLRAPVDAFFEKVMVNAEDVAIRTNRLALLRQLYAQINRIADLSKLASSG